MSMMARSKMMGIFVVLTLALAGVLFIPAGASAEGMANLKVVVRDNLYDRIEDATVYCVNVHTGVRYDLNWDNGDSRYEADVPAGSYQIFAFADGYKPQSTPMVFKKLTGENDDDVKQVVLNLIGTSGVARVHVTYKGDDVEGAKVHLFGPGGVHLWKSTTPKGWANISAPEGVELHMLVFAPGKITFSSKFTLMGTMDMWANLTARPAVKENSYMVLGLVMNGSVNIPDLMVNVWDRENGHYVPIMDDFEGAISLPLYESVFHVLIEAEGYEALLEQDIDLTAMSYYEPEGDSFEMKKIETPGGKVTTVNLAGDIANPMVKTVWTMDANSRIFGTLNTFGNPRMQIAGTPFTMDWFQADGSEVNASAQMMRDFGPAWLSTEDFLKVNDNHYESNLEGFSVDVAGLEGPSLETGVNPVATMTTHYTSDLVFKKGNDIKVEVFSILDDETVEIILPSNYEILGEFGDKAEFIDENTSKIRVFEPIEFNAKEKERPEAKLRFVNSYDFYRVEPDVYIVKVDENITLTAEDSVDPVGSIEKYIWKNLPNSIVIWDEDEEDFVSLEDMDLSTMEKFTFQFTANSNDFYNITLNVQDSSMLRSEKLDWIHLMPDDKAPTVETFTMIYVDTGENLTMEGEMYLADEDLEIEFNASDATDGKEGVIVDYVWTFGDDTPSVNGEVVIHRFSDPGTFNVSLRIVDAVGNEVELVNHTTIKVADTTKPMAVIKPFPDVDQGDSVEMNASQSYDPRSTGNLEEDIVAWTWTMRAEGQNWTLQEEFGTERIFNNTFDEPGTYIINLTVTDKTGLTGYVEKILLVSGPDLQIRGVTFSDPDENDMTEKEETTISVAYSNAGTVDVNATWKIVIKDNTKVVKEHEVVGVIKAGETFYYNTTYKLKKGARNFEVMLDFDDVVKEMNEDNNEFETSVDVKGAPSPIKWWYVAIALLVVLIGYVVYMKYTRSEWGYEPIQRWWERRNA
jgi:hypothetical protein